MSVTVTVKDNETGDQETLTVEDGDYLLTVVNPCYLDGVHHYANGTAVLTIKGRTVGLADVLAERD